NCEAGAKVCDLGFVELLLLVGDVAAFAGFTEAVAFDSLGEDKGGLAFAFDSALVGVVDLFGIVAAAAQFEDLFVAEVGDDVEELGVFAEEVLADECAVLGHVALKFAIDDFAHAALQQPARIALQKRIPIGAPDGLDDIPAGAAEGCFELLNDLAVAAHGPIQALQIAVDDENEVVELFARGERDGAHRFGLVHFAVAEEGPDVARSGRDDAAVFQ